MAVSRNRVDVMGYLGSDPELSFFEGFTRVTFSVAVTTRWKTEKGEDREHLEWVRCALKEQNANGGGTRPMSRWVAAALKAGDPVAVVGSLRSTAKEKDGVTTYYTEVRVEDVQVLKAIAGRE